MKKIKDSKVPEKVLSEANFYFDYKLSRKEICSQDEITGLLPVRLKQDIMLSQYRHFIENSILFRANNGKIDITLAQALLHEVKLETYLIDEYIIKAGQSTTDTFLVIDGFVKVIGINQPTIEGHLEPGDFYSTDLNEMRDEEFDNNYFHETNNG